jgi:hypothetical protein
VQLKHQICRRLFLNGKRATNACALERLALF